MYEWIYLNEIKSDHLWLIGFLVWHTGDFIVFFEISVGKL